MDEQVFALYISSYTQKKTPGTSMYQDWYACFVIWKTRIHVYSFLIGLISSWRHFSNVLCVLFLSGYFYLFDIYTRNSCKQDPRHFDFDTLYNISLRCVFTEGQCLVVVHLNSPLPTSQPAAANSQNGDNKDEHHHQNHGSSDNAIVITTIFEEYPEIKIIADEISWWKY